MSASETVFLRHGLVVPLAAVRLALDLERRGCHLEVDGADILVGPGTLVTAEDRANIRELKPHLLALVAYVAREHAQ